MNALAMDLTLFGSEERKAWFKDFYWGMTPVERSIHNMAHSLVSRTGPKGAYTKKGIENRLGTVGEIKDHLREHYSEDIRRLLDAKEVPTVNRIDPDGHYEPTNIEVISRRENSRLARYQYRRPESHPTWLPQETVEAIVKDPRSHAVVAKEYGLHKQTVIKRRQQARKMRNQSEE